jgi:hypothetical protein
VDVARRGPSVLKATEGFCRKIGRVGHGTQIARAVAATYSGHDRVVIFTDMQTFPHQKGWWEDRYGVGGRERRGAGARPGLRLQPRGLRPRGDAGRARQPA